MRGDREEKRGEGRDEMWSGSLVSISISVSISSSPGLRSLRSVGRSSISRRDSSLELDDYVSVSDSSSSSSSSPRGEVRAERMLVGGGGGSSSVSGK